MSLADHPSGHKNMKKTSTLLEYSAIKSEITRVRQKTIGWFFL